MIKMLAHPEVLRRLAALAGLLAAIWLFLWPVQYVYRVNLVDFAADQARARWADDRALPLPQYIAKQTKGRLRQVQGPAWQELLGMLIQAKQGREAPRLQGRKYQISPKYTAYYYFAPGDQPMASLGLEAGSYTYLGTTWQGRQYYLGLSLQKFRWADNAPTWMLFPGRAYFWIPLALGLLGYLLIPRRKRPEGALGYSRFSAQVMPDILGLFLAGAFFALPLLVVPGNADPWEVFDVFGGWGIFTLIIWVFLAGCGVAILVIAARYAGSWLKVGQKGFSRATLGGVEQIAYEDLEHFEPYQRRPPRWLVWGLLIFGRGNPTAVGQALLIDSRASHGLEFQLTSGRRVRMSIDGLPGVDKLAQALEQAGVEIKQP